MTEVQQTVDKVKAEGYSGIILIPSREIMVDTNEDAEATAAVTYGQDLAASETWKELHRETHMPSLPVTTKLRWTDLLHCTRPGSKLENDAQQLDGVSFKEWLMRSLFLCLKKLRTSLPRPCQKHTSVCNRVQLANACSSFCVEPQRIMVQPIELQTCSR